MVATDSKEALQAIKQTILTCVGIQRDAHGRPIVEHKNGRQVYATKKPEKYDGHCAISVETGINAGLKPLGKHVDIANANNVAPELVKAGFQAVGKGTDKNFKPVEGDVMVIDPCKGSVTREKAGHKVTEEVDHKSGHVAYYTGDPPSGKGWVSDAIQGKDQYPLVGVSEKTQAAKTTIYRHPELAAQAASQTQQYAATTTKASPIATAPGMG